MRWSKDYDVNIKKKTKYDKEKEKVFAIILGQFDKPMKNRGRRLSKIWSDGERLEHGSLDRSD
jgi:hypothetical protein